MRNFSKLGGFGVSCASENGRFSSRQPSYCVSTSLFRHAGMDVIQAEADFAKLAMAET
jgi:hypothetical protein